MVAVCAVSFFGGGLGALGCGPRRDEKGSSKAFRATRRQQLIGGPAALAEIGDYVLENDRVRVAILQSGNSVGPGVFGGSLIDADLNRPQAEYQGGRGNDQFAEMFPSVNLLVPNPGPDDIKTGPNWDGPPGDGPEKACPAIWPTDESGTPLPKSSFSAVCAAGLGDNYLDALELLSVFVGEASFQTDYILQKGKRYVEVVTTLEAKDGDRTVTRPMCPFRRAEDLGHEPLSVLEAIVGTDDYTAGLLSGDFLLFGRRLHVFVDGLGFNEGSYVQELFLSGQDTLNRPVSFPYMAGVGDKVSYALITDRAAAQDPWGVCGANQDEPPKMLVPVETGAFTFVFTHWWRCPADVVGCQDGGRLFYRRYFILGDGDVASLMDVAYDIWQMPVGRLKGVVYDRNSGQPVAHSDVYVIRDPVDPQWQKHYPHADHAQCDVLRDGAGDVVAFRLLEGCARNASVSRDYSLGQLGVTSYIRTDRGDDPIEDGKFSATLPPGSYYVVGYLPGRGPSDAQRIVINENEKTAVGIPLLPQGKVVFDVRNQYEEHIPAKVTIIGDCKDAQGNDVCDCFPATDPQCQGDGIAESGRQILEFGGFRAKAGVVGYRYTITGFGELNLPPGRYRFVFSRGAEYSIDEHVRVVPDDGRAITIHAALNRVVDTTGWISGDFHVHGTNSYDAVPSFEDRITSFLVEGIELLSSSDHDWITDYEPTARKLGIQRWLKTQVGLEITPVEIGHFLGWPLEFKDTLPENGAIDWTDLTPQQIFNSIRMLGRYGIEDTVVTAAHPRDSFFGYFDQFGMSPFDLTLNPGMMQQTNSILRDTGNFHPGIDAIEIINGKRYDMLRTPTNEEVRKFNLCLEFHKGIREELPADITADECDPSWTSDQLRAYWARRTLVRTPAESAAYRYHRDGQRQCVSDEDCVERGNPGHYCNRNSGLCVAPQSCGGPQDCAVGACNTTTNTCYLHAECDPTLDLPDCGAGLICDPEAKRCVAPCTSHRDCHPELRCCKHEECGCKGPTCAGDPDPDVGAGVCVEAKCDFRADWETTGSGAARPCIDWQGAVEDWFRLFNHGVNYTGLGHSDTHTLTKNEPGMCHNMVCSSVDQPSQIDPLEIARNMQDGCVVATYGPFLELWADGQRVGAKVKSDPQSAVSLRVRVQSPAWFDVDRVEVYRNGSLRWIFEGGDESAQCSGDIAGWPCQVDEPEPGFEVQRCACIPLQEGHNISVVNLDVTFDDRPQQDAWYLAVAMAASPQARTMSPIYTWRYYPNMSFGLIVNKALSSFDIGLDLETFFEPTPLTAQVSPVVPYAITNPIWVDRDADGDAPFSFEAPGLQPRWMSNFAKSRAGVEPQAVPSSGNAREFQHRGARTKKLRRADIKAFLLEGMHKHVYRQLRKQPR